MEFFTWEGWEDRHSISDQVLFAEWSCWQRSQSGQQKKCLGNYSRSYYQTAQNLIFTTPTTSCIYFKSKNYKPNKPNQQTVPAISCPIEIILLWYLESLRCACDSPFRTDYSNTPTPLLEEASFYECFFFFVIFSYFPLICLWKPYAISYSVKLFRIFTKIMTNFRNITVHLAIGSKIRFKGDIQKSWITRLPTSTFLYPLSCQAEFFMNWKKPISGE